MQLNCEQNITRIFEAVGVHVWGDHVTRVYGLVFSRTRGLRPHEGFLPLRYQCTLRRFARSRRTML